MIRVPAHVRSLARIVAMCAVAALVLASCATKAKALPHVTGLPAISISVPLSNVACTTNNSCVAIGTSNLDVSPTSVGEYRPANGHWTQLSVPSADSSTYLESSSCWSNGCLFVGSRSDGDLVWNYNAISHSIVAETPPTGASGINAVSCYSSMTCAILDSSKGGVRFLTTDDGGLTWSSPVIVGAATLDFASTLSCTSTMECMASILDSSNGVAIYVSRDGGATWTPRTGFSTVTWSTLTSLSCYAKACLGLANLSTGWRIVRTNDFGKKWSKVSSPHGANLTLACTSLERCVVGGSTNFQSSVPLLATVTSGSVNVAKLKYVPSPISDVACGSNVCAAIGVTTVMTLRP
jgi:hypothetical protein